MTALVHPVGLGGLDHLVHQLEAGIGRQLGADDQPTAIGTAIDDGRQLRTDGWVTVEGLEPNEDVAAQARHLNCSHLLDDGKIREI